MENMKQNNGKGLLDNIGLCDSLINDLNSLPKLLIDNQFILFCSEITQMGQKLLNLKTAISKETESKNKTIEHLKTMLKANEASNTEDNALINSINENGGKNDGGN